MAQLRKKMSTGYLRSLQAMHALVFSTNYRNVDNWMPLFERIQQGGGRCEGLWLPWRGDPSVARMEELTLPVRHSQAIERLDEQGIGREALERLLDATVTAEIDVVFLTDMQSYPSSAVHGLLQRRGRPPKVIGLQHGLFQSWWVYNRNYCADELLVFGARHVRELADSLRARAHPVGLPKLDALNNVPTSDGGYILYLAQGVPEPAHVERLLLELASATGLRIVVRNHPQYPMLLGREQSSGEPQLDGRPVREATYIEQLAHASWVLTPHSTGGIEALHLGKPVVLLPNHGLTAWAGYPGVAISFSTEAVLAALDRARTQPLEVELFLEDAFGGLRFDAAVRAADTVTRLVGERRGPLLRRDDVVSLVRPGGVGIELGVAEGVFSERLLLRGVLSHLYSVDMYAGDRGHDNEQYKRALRRLGPFRDRNTLIKMPFNEVLDLFPDESFDFIYVDGYAHTGEEGGKTFDDWYPKLKPGGLLAGDDYCPDWPLVMESVDRFLATNGLPLNVIDCREDLAYCKYPTWFTRKPG